MLTPQAVDPGTSWCPDMAEVQDRVALAAVAFWKLCVSFWEESAAVTMVLPQERSVCSAGLVQQLERTSLWLSYP